jgi:hypothetical protein
MIKLALRELRSQSMLISGSFMAFSALKNTGIVAVHPRNVSIAEGLNEKRQLLYKAHFQIDLECQHAIHPHRLDKQRLSWYCPPQQRIALR